MLHKMTLLNRIKAAASTVSINNTTTSSQLFKSLMNRRNFSTQTLLRNNVPTTEQNKPKTAFESKQDKRMKELEERLLKGKAGVLITNKREKEIVVSGVILTFALFFVSLLFTIYRVYDTYLQKQIRFLPSPFVKLEENQIDCVDFFGHHYYYMPKETLTIEEIEELEKKSIR